MEPRPHERGKVHCVISSEVKRVRFNGATSSRTWKGHIQKFTERVLSMLQWSHVLTNVERGAFLCPFAGVVEASMEPRPHERGKTSASTCSSVVGVLQWSHVLTNVESPNL